MCPGSSRSARGLSVRPRGCSSFAAPVRLTRRRHIRAASRPLPLRTGEPLGVDRGGVALPSALAAAPGSERARPVRARGRNLPVQMGCPQRSYGLRRMLVYLLRLLFTLLLLELGLHTLPAFALARSGVLR